jgi:hypothetical protein
MQSQSNLPIQSTPSVPNPHATPHPEACTLSPGCARGEQRFSTPWFVLGTTVLVVGCVSLLVALDYLPNIDWVWVLMLLGMAGLSLIAGINKVSFVLAGALFAASVGSVLRQTGRITMNVEVPVLIMFTGVLILVAMVLKLRTPAMLAVRKAL